MLAFHAPRLLLRNSINKSPNYFRDGLGQTAGRDLFRRPEKPDAHHLRQRRFLDAEARQGKLMSAIATMACAETAETRFQWKHRQSG
jgi:hypothetical protein